MTYSDVIILRLTRLCDEKKITINKLYLIWHYTVYGGKYHVWKDKKSQTENLA